MPDKLPKGWVETTIGEVCAMNPRPAYDELPPEETDISFVPMAAVEEESGRLDATQVRPLAAARKGYTPFKENDVIFAKITPCMENGKIALATELKNGLAYGSTEFFVFRPYEGLLPRFVLHFLLQPSFRQEAERRMTGAVGQKRVPSNYLLTHPFALPPTREQGRIVAKLDVLLAQVSAGEAAARRALDRLQRYRAAVLNAAVTGKLTREWRKTHPPEETGAQLLKRSLVERRARWEDVELKRLNAAGKPPKDDKWKKRYHEPKPPSADEFPEIPLGWAIASIDQLGWTSGYGTSVKCTPDANGPAVLRIPNIRNRRLDFTDLKFATNLKEFTDEAFVKPGDLLLIRTNGSIDLIGRAAIAKSELETKCCFASYLIRFRLVGDTALWTWISLAWESNKIRSEIRSRAATTAGQYNVSLSGLADLALPLPPSTEQKEIVREIERRFTAADRLASTLNRQLERARITRQSLLREAFAGKLVPQDPTDEPASALLERIRAAHEAEAKKPKAKRMPKTKLTFVTRKLFDLIKDKFGDSAFTFDALRKEAHPTKYDDLRNDLYELLRPKTPGAVPPLRMSFDAKKEVMEFSLQRL